MAASPIVNLHISPSYGEHKALLRWEVTEPKYLYGNFIVQKSPDGYTNWVTVKTGFGITAYVDPEFTSDNAFDNLHYKVVLQYSGERYDSNSVGIYDTLHPKEFAALRRMIQIEVLTMRNGRQGIELLAFKPLRTGTVASNVDADTKQSLGNTESTESYGQRYVGGYDVPIRILCTIVQDEKQEIQSDQEGFGAKAKPTSVIRMVAFPELLREDLVVNPRTDDRYLVNAVERFRFKGIVPFVDQVQLLRLDRSDVRYKLKV